MTKYGYFDDANREYVITRPDTPLPWLNYLGQEELFGLCTNTAGGYTFWKDARMRRLTRYRYNNIPFDSGGRYLYINDNGTVWNPGWKPVKAELDSYECRHGLGYSNITGEKNGIKAEILFFIPPGEHTEIWRVTVSNTGSEQKNISLFSFVEFCTFEALNDMSNYQRTYSIGEVEVEGNAIYHKTEYRERRNHYTLFGVTKDIAGFDTSRDRFVGVHNGLHEAAVPFSGKAGSSGYCGWNPAGSHQLDLSLEPGENETFSFILAYIDHGAEHKFEKPFVINKEKGRALLGKYKDDNAVLESFGKVTEAWEGHLSKIQVATPNEHLTRMVNVWNPAQCMATFNLSRSTSMFETGIGRGMGYRDSNQDLLGFVHMIPERARERICDIAATQMSDGTCYHQYQPLTKQGNAEIGGDFYDDHLWLILSTCAYIKETGDVSILDEEVGYPDTDKKGSLRDHLELSINFTMKQRGPHGLPLIGHADWNDCLNLNCFSTEPNESFQTAGDVAGSQAESVMIAGLFLYASRELARLYEWMGLSSEAERISKLRDEMLEAVEKEAWDGEWYTRAFDAESRPVGSKSCEEGKIYIESNGWCVLGGAGAKNGRAQQAMKSVDKHLFTPYGVVLQQPPYSEYHVELGEVSSYPPGFKENAGVFSHNNTWIHLDWCLLGEGDKALEYYLSICPSAKQETIDTYRCEPYVYAQMTAGPDAPTPGEAKNSWLTGTAAWSFVTAVEGILGVKPSYTGLEIDPCISKEWKEFSVTREFRGTEYRIRVSNPDGISKGVKTITVDGETIDGMIVPLSDKDVVEVEVVMGK